MPDNLSKSKRSKVMSSIRSKDTVPEILMRKALFAGGYRYSLKKRIAGVRPDIVLVSRKACIFVDGCFWHGCPKCFKPPASNVKYWGPKIEKNKERDKRQTRDLRRAGWKVLRIWEHEIRKNLSRTVKKIKEILEDLP